LRAALLCCALVVVRAPAQSKKDDKKDAPKILCASPLAVRPGATRTIKLRGLGLADASAVKVTTDTDTPIPATIKSKGKSEAPKPFETNKIGDTDAQLELKVPADLKPTTFTITLTTPTGSTPPFVLRVADAATTVDEKEPNNGFKGAQELAIGKTVLGLVEGQGDVDVYKVGGAPGTKILVELVAARRGSPMDGALTLYDAAGHVLANADDAPAPAAPDAKPSPGNPKDAPATPQPWRDPVLRFTLPQTGVVYVAAFDANDRGSAVHAYELSVREDK
jgi:hypothetical protein